MFKILNNLLNGCYTFLFTIVLRNGLCSCCFFRGAWGVIVSVLEQKCENVQNIPERKFIFFGRRSCMDGLSVMEGEISKSDDYSIYDSPIGLKDHELFVMKL